MTTLANTSLIVAAIDRALTVGPAEVLRRAGALVQVCTPQRDLWSTLADSLFDAIVIVGADGDDSPMAAFTPLFDDPRSRHMPCVLLLSAERLLSINAVAQLRGAALLPVGGNEQDLLETIGELVAERRRSLEAEVEYRALSESVRIQSQRADRLNAELGNLSHDLRGMLGVAFGFACNLRDGVTGPQTEAQRTHVARILEAINNATELLDSLGDARRHINHASVRQFPSVRSERAQRSHVQLGRLVQDVLALLEQKAANRNITLSDNVDESVSVWADALKLKQVVINLVDNAIKYGVDGGRVVVQVKWSQASSASGRQSRKIAQLTVSDTGPGIPAELRERVFERGFRGEQTEAGTGHGIGLNLVREIVVQHGGSIQCEPGQGEGASFCVSLPPDLRERESKGLLVLRDSESAQSLLHLLDETKPALQAALPEDEKELARLVRNCEAAVLLPTRPSTNPRDLLASLVPQKGDG